MSDYEYDSCNIKMAREDEESEESDNARYKDLEESEFRKNGMTGNKKDGNKDIENIRRSYKEHWTRDENTYDTQFQKRYNKYLSKYKSWKKYAVKLSNERKIEIDQVMNSISYGGYIQVTFTIGMIIIQMTLIILLLLSSAIETNYFI